MSRVSDKFVVYLFCNNKKIRRDLDLFLNEGFEVDFSDSVVVSSRYGNSTESDVISKITDKDYLFKSKCLDVVDNVINRMPFVDYDIFMMKYKRGYSSERIGREFNYSRATIDRKLKYWRNILISDFEKIERVVYDY